MRILWGDGNPRMHTELFYFIFVRAVYFNDSYFYDSQLLCMTWRFDVDCRLLLLYIKTMSFFVHTCTNVFVKNNLCKTWRLFLEFIFTLTWNIWNLLGSNVSLIFWHTKYHHKDEKYIWWQFCNHININIF